MDNKLFLEADIKVQEETEDLKKAVAGVVNLPNEKEKQADLLYFSAIFVSTGTNLNNAHFQSSELVMAEKTIVNKALDVEHKEEEIIGHIYDRAFMDKDGSKVELSELASSTPEDLNTKNMHVVIAGIIYKNRFPKIAEEVASGEWKVSMECYFTDYDVKVGEMIMSRKEAEAMGYADVNTLIGKVARVMRKGVEVSKGTVERVLRGIMFSGCGIVKNPANPPSIILETANEKDNPNKNSKDIVIFDFDKIITNNVTSSSIESDTPVITEENTEEAKDDTIGICVSYKKRVYSGEPIGPDTQIVHENWCSLYEKACTSFSRDTTDPECLRNQLGAIVRTYAKKLLIKEEKRDRRNELVARLNIALEKAKLLD